MRIQDVFGGLGLYCAMIHFLPPLVNDSEEVSVVTPQDKQPGLANNNEKRNGSLQNTNYLMFLVIARLIRLSWMQQQSAASLWFRALIKSVLPLLLSIWQQRWTSIDSCIEECIISRKKLQQKNDLSQLLSMLCELLDHPWLTQL